MRQEIIKLVREADKQVKGIGTNGKEISQDRGTLKDWYQRRLLLTKRCPLARNAERLIEVTINKERTFVTFMARKGTMQEISIRSETKKAK